MYFGLCNSPATFQAMMNDIFKDELRHQKCYLIIYMDDLLIFAETIKELRKQTKEILQKMRNNDLYLKPEKCEFERTKLEYLGMTVEEGKVSMNPDKIKGIKEWPEPTNVKEVRQFLGFGNFYQKFIRNYSDLAKPLNELLQKDKEFLWTPEAQKAFDKLKQRFTTETVLSMPDPKKLFQIEADASKYASGAVLSQKDKEEKQHPCAFISQSFSPAEQNYVIEERELLAILRALREWRHYIIGGKYPTTVLTDHKNLEKWSRGRQMKDQL